MIGGLSTQQASVGKGWARDGDGKGREGTEHEGRMLEGGEGKSSCFEVR